MTGGELTVLGISIVSILGGGVLGFAERYTGRRTLAPLLCVAAGLAGIACVEISRGLG